MKSDFYEEYFRHENSHWWFRWRFDLIAQVVGSLTHGRDVRILDAGCGTGQMTKLLENYGTAIGLDLAPEAIHYAKQRGVRNLVQGSITDPPFKAGSFDCVLALDVIEHVDDDAQILARLREIVRPGGHLIVTVPAFNILWSEHDEINHHRRRYRVPQLRRLMEEAGYEVERITYCNTTLYLPVLVMRKGKSLLRRLRKQERTDEPESDLSFYPRPINELLYRVMQLENRLMRRWGLPFGVSILAVARRPETDQVTEFPIATIAAEEPALAGETVPAAEALAAR
jgi:SAM-dependent methyltransferase